MTATLLKNLDIHRYDYESSVLSSNQCWNEHYCIHIWIQAINLYIAPPLIQTDTAWRIATLTHTHKDPAYSKLGNDKSPKWPPQIHSCPFHCQLSISHTIWAKFVCGMLCTSTSTSGVPPPLHIRIWYDQSRPLDPFRKPEYKVYSLLNLLLVVLFLWSYNHTIIFIYHITNMPNYNIGFITSKLKFFSCKRHNF